MSTGNMIHHLAAQARETGRAEIPWPGLRHAHFSAGTPEDGFEAMVLHFAELGIKATSEWRNADKGQIEVIVLVPL